MTTCFPVFRKTGKGDNMAKRANLAANVKAAAGTPVALPLPAAKPQPAPKATPETKRTVSRAGRKAVYAWVDPTEHMKLKRLALDTGLTIEALVTDGVQLVFAKHKVK
jgi:hypothetical protein